MTRVGDGRSNIPKYMSQRKTYLAGCPVATAASSKDDTVAVMERDGSLRRPGSIESRNGGVPARSSGDPLHQVIQVLAGNRGLRPVPAQVHRQTFVFCAKREINVSTSTFLSYRPGPTEGAVGIAGNGGGASLTEQVLDDAPLDGAADLVAEDEDVRGGLAGGE